MLSRPELLAMLALIVLLPTGLASSGCSSTVQKCLCADGTYEYHDVSSMYEAYNDPTSCCFNGKERRASAVTAAERQAIAEYVYQDDASLTWWKEQEVERMSEEAMAADIVDNGLYAMRKSTSVMPNLAIASKTLSPVRKSTKVINHTSPTETEEFGEERYLAEEFLASAVSLNLTDFVRLLARQFLPI